jgi:hypothetical protein
MRLSVYGQAVEDAREAATALGHKLSKFDVIRCAAYAACGMCHMGVSVLFHRPVVTLGNAVEMTCKAGEENVTPPVKPAPSRGAARRLPKPAPAAPATDDLPWFMRDKVPAAVRS